MEEKLKEKDGVINELIAKTLELMPEEGKDVISKLGLEIETSTKEHQTLDERE